MKVSPTLAILVAACAVFLFSPYFPSALLSLLVGNWIMTGVLLVASLLILRRDTVLGLAAFLAIAALFLEHRRRLVTKVQIALGGGGPQLAGVEELSKPAPDLVKGEVHPEGELPHYEEHPFEPSEQTGSNDFKGVAYGESLNEKEPLETVPPHPDRVSEYLQERGFASPFESSNSAA